MNLHTEWQGSNYRKKKIQKRAGWRGNEKELFPGTLADCKANGRWVLSEKFEGKKPENVLLVQKSWTLLLTNKLSDHVTLKQTVQNENN